MASDSQTTWGSVKRTDTDKISLVDFDGGAALVAESGTCSLSGVALRLLQEKAKAQKITADDSPAQLAKDAIREVRNDQRSLYPGSHAPETWQRHFRDESPMGLTIAYWFDGKAKLYTVTIDECMPIPMQGRFIATGCGGDLGEYLLSEFYVEEQGHFLASIVAAYVVEMVKQHDACCGGPTRLGWVRTRSPMEAALVKAGEGMGVPPGWREFDNYSVGSLPQCRTDEIVKEALAIQREIQTRFAAQTARGFAKASKRIAKDFERAHDRFIAEDPPSDLSA